MWQDYLAVRQERGIDSGEESEGEADDAVGVVGEMTMMGVDTMYTYYFPHFSSDPTILLYR